MTKAVKPLSRKFATQFTYKPRGSSAEKNDGTSQTIPDDHLTILELLENHSKGIPIRRAIPSIYTGDQLAPTFYDLTDAQAYAEDLKSRAELVEQQIREHEAAKVQQTVEDPIVDPNYTPPQTTDNK